MPVPSPRNSIRVARGNYADLAANVAEIGEGELCFASDQDKFYSKSDNALVAVGGGTELNSIQQLGDVTLTALENGQFLQWNGSAWVNVNAVDSVNGQTGAVVLALDDIDDVDLTTTPPNAGEVLGWNGSEWVPTENTGAGSTLNSTRYRYENNTDINSVGAGKVRFNSTTFTLVTEIAFSNVDKNGVDIGAILQNMVNENYSVYFQQEDNAGKAVLFHFTGGCSNVGDNLRSKFPVEHISDSGSALSGGKDCYTVLSAQAVADSVTSVNGQQGAVVLNANDVGLGNVDNTSDADKPVSTATQTALDAKADLVGGFVPTSQIPAIAITEFLGSVADETAMLALTGQPGDWCLRTDKAVGYVIVGADPSLIENWEAFTVPGSAVTTINTQVGDVVLGAADVGAATAAQGLLADTATQPGDNISTLTNDSAFINAAGAPVQSVNGSTGDVTLAAADVGAATAAQGATADSALQPNTSIAVTGIDISGVQTSNIASATYSVDCSLGNYFTASINGSGTFSFSNVPAAKSYGLTIEVTHTSGTISWPTSVTWPKETAPELTTGKTHVFVLITDDGGTRWRGAALVGYAN